MSESTRPRANHAEFLIEEMDNELLVYDEQRQLACRLNRTAAVVWKHCDGDHDISELVEVLRDEIGELADEDLVMITLDQLQEQGLLATGHGPRDITTARESRRRFIRRVGVVGAAALALPVVQSIVAPPARAATSTSCSCDCYFTPCGCVDYCYCSPPFTADRQQTFSDRQPTVSDQQHRTFSRRRHKPR